MLTKLNIVRDCWWMMPDSVTQADAHSTPTYSFSKTVLNSDLNLYVKESGGGHVTYYGRLESTNIEPSSIFFEVAAKCAPLGSSVLLINDVEIGSVICGPFGTTLSDNFLLTEDQRQGILSGRIDSNYDYFAIKVNSHQATTGTFRLCNASIYYSGDATWDNYETGLPNVVSSTYYPSSLSFRNNAYWSGDVSVLSDVDDNTYIENVDVGNSGLYWNHYGYNGGLTLHFDAPDQSFNRLTRAQLNLSLSIPASGGNEPDTFEVNGYNALYSNQDNITELTNLNIDRVANDTTSGYFLYGAGSVVDYSGVTSYAVELNFIDSVNLKPSTHNANTDMLSNMHFQLVGLPSGTKMHEASLQIESVNDSMIGLYTAGDVSRCSTAGSVDAGTAQSFSYGNGGWHHKGWRVGGDNIIEEDTFTNFYTFTEQSGTRTYPESIYALYFPGGQEDDTVYADYLSVCPYDRIVDSPQIDSYLINPLRREYHRNPITAEDLTPEDEGTARDISGYAPSYYKTMLYHDASITGGSSLNTDSVSQVFFGDRLDLTEDFTLYFCIYRSYDLPSYGRFFHRGLVEQDGINNYEIYGDLFEDYVKFTVKGANGSNNTVEVDIDQNTKEPILIWFSCSYEQLSTNYTTMTLHVHQDTTNYFGSDWLIDQKSFVGHRKEYTSGGLRTVLGTLETLSAAEQLVKQQYLNYASIVEFGYANEYIELDYQTSESTTAVGYDVSTDKDKLFFNSRIANSYYINPHTLGVYWSVPAGSGAAQWSTRYNLSSLIMDSGNIHSIFNPVSTAGNYIVAPSAVWIQFEAAQNTNHPSGLTLEFDVQFDTEDQTGWKVAHAEVAIPSGGFQYISYSPIIYNTSALKHVNMYGEPLLISSVDNVDLIVTTKYVDHENYYGEVELRSVNITFDSFCSPSSTYNTLNLYTEGSPYYSSGDMTVYISGDPTITVTKDIDLFTLGPTPNAFNDGMDLFSYGSPVGTGVIYTSIPLFLNSNLNPVNRLPMYIHTGSMSKNTNMNLVVYNKIPSINSLPSGLPLCLRSSYGISGLDYTTDLLLDDDDEVLTSSGDIIILSAYDYPPNVTNLYINGYGTTDGYYWKSTDMNLYMSRETEAVAGRLELYMAQQNMTESLDSYTYGHIFNNTVTPFNSDLTIIQDVKNDVDFLSSSDFAPSTEVPNIVQDSHTFSAVIDSGKFLTTQDIPYDYSQSYVYSPQRTWCFWYKKDSIDLHIATDYIFLSTGGVIYDGYIRYTLAQNTFVPSLFLNKTPSTLSFSVPSASGYFMDTDWHHHAIVLDGESSTQSLQLWVDGSLIGSAAGTPNDLLSVQAPFCDGYLFGSWSSDSYIYDVRVYDGALSESQITDVKSGSAINTSLLAHYLPSRQENLSLFIYGSGLPETKKLNLFTHGF